MVGGAMSGYCSTGSDISPMAPNNTKKMDITVDSTGRFMNFEKVMYALFYRLKASLQSGSRSSYSSFMALINEFASACEAPIFSAFSIFFMYWASEIGFISMPSVSLVIPLLTYRSPGRNPSVTI